MPRKGSTKVKTGCLTCKTRKVKCDEAKPHCRRCTTTGRSCDGYSAPPTGQAAYSWARLLAAPTFVGTRPSSTSSLSTDSGALVIRRNPSALPTDSDMEARALDFFRAQVAPVLSRHSSKNFWGTFVSQVGQRESVVRHALVCISSTYEGLGDGSASLLRPSRERFATSQYNMALRHLTAPNAAADRNLVLLVCMLFICIEAMRGDKEMAIAHSRHGVNLWNSWAPAGLAEWAERELRPMFLRLSTLPYYFGTEKEDFPEPVALRSTGPLEPASDGSGTVLDGDSLAWATVVNRTIRFVGEGLSYQQGRTAAPGPCVLDGLLQEQRGLLQSLGAWRRHYAQIRAARCENAEELQSHLFHEMECIAGDVWVGCCLSAHELVYDEHMGDFEEMMRLSQRLVDVAVAAGDTGPRPKFMLEMGFAPLLYYVVLKCRRLDLRLEALRHMHAVACDKEHLFDSKMLRAVGRRCVEIEHGIQLHRHMQEDHPPSTSPMPPDGARIRTLVVTDEVEARDDGDGALVDHRRVYFVVRPGAIVSGFDEWIIVG